MAKKTSSNAIKKIDEQISQLESTGRKNGTSSTTRKTTATKKSVSTSSKKSSTTTKKKSVRDEVVVVPAKKTTSVKKKTTSSVKSTARKTTRSTSSKAKDDKLKTNLKEITTKSGAKRNKTTVRSKKDLVAEVNKILGIPDESTATEEKQFEEFSFVETPEEKKLDAIQTPKEEFKEELQEEMKRLQTPKKEIEDEFYHELDKISSPAEEFDSKKDFLKENNEDIEILSPEEAFEEKVDKELALTEQSKEELETKIKDFLETEEKKETPIVSTEESLDEIDVIKFSDRKKTTITPKKSGNLKKKTKEQDEKKKSVDLDHIDSLEEYNIVEDFKKDIPPKSDFKRKRKGKGYVVSIPKKPSYKELESDIRSLYDKTNEIVDDFETTKAPKKKFEFKFRKDKKKPVEKPVKRPVKPVKQPVKPVPIVPKKEKKIRKVIEEEEITEYERPSILDHISQRVLNFFLIVLFTIFTLMVIAFIAFVIYVSTF